MRCQGRSRRKAGAEGQPLRGMAFCDNWPLGSRLSSRQGSKPDRAETASAPFMRARPSGGRPSFRQQFRFRLLALPTTDNTHGLGETFITYSLAAIQGDAACAPETELPGLRDDRAGGAAVVPNRARSAGPGPSRPRCRIEIRRWSAAASKSPEGASDDVVLPRAVVAPKAATPGTFTKETRPAGANKGKPPGAAPQPKDEIWAK
jgi:hypothetical protein